MTRYSFGDPSASGILVQLVDDHDLSLMDSEARMIRELAGEDFFLLALKVNNWNKDLTPLGMQEPLISRRRFSWAIIFSSQSASGWQS